MSADRERIAVVGAGMAGATCADLLRRAGHDVTVFEKSRGAGGRMSTRRGEDVAFDHGAQYMTARTAGFQDAVSDWVAAGVAAPWELRLVDLEAGVATPHPSDHPRYVGVPGMNAICKHLLEGIDLVRATRIVRIDRTDAHWTLADESRATHGPFDAVVVTAPPVQAAALLHDAPVLAAEAKRAELAPCWTWMIAFDDPTSLDFDGAFVKGSPLTWIARNSAKPGRPGARETWIAQASPEWSSTHVEDDPTYVASALEDAFRRDTAYVGAAPTTAMLHRWLYAFPSRDLGTPFLWDASRRIGACGDWIHGSRVESAWLSGHALATAMGAAHPPQVS